MTREAESRAGRPLCKGSDVGDVAWEKRPEYSYEGRSSAVGRGVNSRPWAQRDLVEDGPNGTDGGTEGYRIGWQPGREVEGKEKGEEVRPPGFRSLEVVEVAGRVKSRVEARRQPGQRNSVGRCAARQARGEGRVLVP